MVHIGKERTTRAGITRTVYDADCCEETDITNAPQQAVIPAENGVTWIDVRGVHDIDVVARVGEQLDLHPLVLEDVVNTQQRPKLEDYGRYLFIVVKMLHYDQDTHGITAEQVSLILGDNFVVSFQEGEGDSLAAVSERLKTGKGRIKEMGADYLAYALLDAVIDGYFVVLEQLSEEIEDVQERLIRDPGVAVLGTIHRLKNEVIVLRRTVWPVREVANALQRGESPLVRETTIDFLRDAYDHSFFVIETAETFRDMVSSMIDLYLSSVSNRMNQIMKVLTIIATIFIPLTFIAGVYGMNFHYMPELSWYWGYPSVLILMAVVAVTMLLYFRTKRWL